MAAPLFLYLSQISNICLLLLLWAINRLCCWLVLRSSSSSMETPLHIPSAFDKHNLKSCFQCTNCEAYLGNRPITTRCGHTICRKCALKGKCPIDACRQYSWTDCPYDFKLGNLLEEIEKVIQSAAEEGLWKKRKRITDSPFDELRERTPPPPPVPAIPRRSSFFRYLPFHYRRTQSTTSTPNVTNVAETVAQNIEPVLSSIEGAVAAQVVLISPNQSFGDTHSEASTATFTTSFRNSLEPDLPTENDIANLLATRILDGFNCDICCHCFLEPMTLRCGHTYCRECLHRSIEEKSFSVDSANYRILKPTCPLCRQSMGSLLPLGQAMHHEHTWNWAPNRTLQRLISICWVPQLEESKKYNAQMSRLVPDGMDIPLFVCTTSIPTQPTRLQIFEPKYRTMMRRVLRSPDRTFGMTLGDRNNPSRPFANTGVLLQIESVQYFRPGSVSSPGPPSDDVVMLVDTRGISRFEIKDWQQYHGYWTVKAEPFYDLPDWESKEKPLALQDSSAAEQRLSSVGYDSSKLTIQWFLKALTQDAQIAQLLSTQQIILLLHEIINTRRKMLRKAVWDKIVASHGTPTHDPSELSWWFPGVFIGDNKVRMTLLEMTNPADRLQHILTTIGAALM